MDRGGALGVPYIALQATAWRGTRFRLSEEPLNRLRAAHGLPEDPGAGAVAPVRLPDDAAAGAARPGRPDAGRDPPDPRQRTRAAGGEPPWWPSPDGGRPRVVVTMGTILAGRHDAMGAILDGLEPLDVDIVAMVGHDLDPALLGQRRATTRVVRYLPVTRPRSESDLAASCSTPGRGRCSRRWRRGCRW